MLKSHDIIILDRSTYSKKSSKSNICKQSDSFIIILQKKLNEWNFTYSFDKKHGDAYKVKYNQFEKAFFEEFNIVLYLVSSSSTESFQKSIKRLICTCHDKEKLSRIMIVSLDEKDFPDLQGSAINVVHFGNNEEEYEDYSQWKVFQEELTTKLQNVRSGNTNQQNTAQLTIPTSIKYPKSPSKFKSILHYLPQIFDHEKAKSSPNNTSDHSLNESSHDITIVQSQKEVHNSKIFLNSWLKKPSQKTRDSGLSIDSSTSSCGGSKESETMCMDKSKSSDIGFDTISDSSPSSDKHLFFCSASLEKPKSSKMQMPTFNNKTMKALHTAKSLHSPDTKSGKNIKDAVCGFALVSNFLIAATSDLVTAESTPALDSQDKTYSRGNRCQSEPPFAGSQTRDNSPMNDRINYLWDADMLKVEEVKMYDLTFKKPEIKELTLQPMVHEASCNTMLEATIDVCNYQSSSVLVSNKFYEEDINLFINRHPENSTDNDFDRQYFQVQYPTNSINKSPLTRNHSRKNNIDNIFQLKTIAEDIQQQYQKKSKNTESSADNIISLKSFKVQSEILSNVNETEIKERVDALNLLNDLEKLKISEGHVPDLRNITNGNMLRHEMKMADNLNPIQTINRSSYLSNMSENEIQPLQIDSECSNSQQCSDKSTISEMMVNTIQSYLNVTAYSLINNPIGVCGIFTITALTAPIWRTYIPNNVNFGQILYETAHHILRNEMVQSIPNQLISTARQSTIATTSSLRRIFIT